ncbi:MAG TPA: lysylphosphatidylglycerol synthase transmembrane domain-containing protein [Gaiellaceae bacterium]
MQEVIDAVQAFFDHLAAVRWAPLGYACACQLAKLIVISRAWRNVLAAAYPEARVTWLRCFEAWVAGAGVNAVIPARGGDVVKLFIAKRGIVGSTYPTLVSTVLLLSLFDMVVAGGFVAWALTQHLLPTLDILSRIPSFDFGWFVRHPRLAAVIAGVVLALLLVGTVWTRRRVIEFRARVAQGFAVLHDRPRYLRTVLFWQVCDWALRLATIFFFLRAFGVAATPHSVVLVQVSQSLASIFPVSPGGLGTEQALLLYLFRGVTSRTGALGFSVGMRVTLAVVNVALGAAAILITVRTLHWRRAIAEQEREAK